MTHSPLSTPTPTTQPLPSSPPATPPMPRLPPSPSYASVAASPRSALSASPSKPVVVYESPTALHSPPAASASVATSPESQRTSISSQSPSLSGSSVRFSPPPPASPSNGSSSHVQESSSPPSASTDSLADSTITGVEMQGDPAQGLLRTLNAPSTLRPGAIFKPAHISAGFNPLSRAHLPPTPATNVLASTSVSDSPIILGHPSQAPSVAPTYHFPQSTYSFADSQYPSTDTCSSTQGDDYSDVDPGGRTPNVYINGLPPHFPEDQLLALATPFGGVRSVRSFTRHVGEGGRPSGYGFVLFDKVESAERCIEALRKYRNLHPSFSKQIHKIPGTAYLSTQPSHHRTLSMSQYSADDEGGGDTFAQETFKMRMERLHDKTSTNLYMEGLPLSIDESTMAALVSPHIIKSTRLFQTKLSDPPRIIAFVRMETRAAAEEIIERLHGRMVRGWNDPGSRISVRFADTAEQRELRRSERSAGEGEQSPARMTMAQAALLNLRGPDMQTQGRLAGATHARGVSIQRNHHRGAEDLGLSGQLDMQSHADALDYTNHPAYSRTRHAGYASPPPLSSNAHSRMPGDFGLRGGLRMTQGMPQHLANQYYAQQSSDVVDPDMAALLHSLRINGSGVPFSPRNANAYGPGFDVDYNLGDAARQTQRHPHGRHDVLSDVNLNVAYPSAGHHLPFVQGQAQARNGYTPAEELILEAARQRNSRVLSGVSRSHPGPSVVSMGMRGHRVQAAPYSLGRGNADAGGEFQISSAAAALAQQQYVQHQQAQGNVGLRGNIRSPHLHAELPLSRDSAPTQQQQQVPSSFYQNLAVKHSINVDPSSHTSNQQSNVDDGSHSNSNNQHAHMRATTLPNRTTTATTQRRHYQHNSISAPMSSAAARSAAAYNQNQQQNYQAGQNAGEKAEPELGDGQYAARDRDGVHAEKYHGQDGQDERAYQDADIYGSSPSLVSPALTYSSRTTASASPATPFFGAFAHAWEGYDAAHAGDKMHGGDKMHAVHAGEKMHPSHAGEKTHGMEKEHKLRAGVQ